MGPPAIVLLLTISCQPNTLTTQQRRFRKALYTLYTMYILHNLIVDGCRLNACRVEGESRGRLLICMSYTLRYLLLKNDGAKLE